MYKGKKVAVIIAAAGFGKRMESSVNKQYLEVGRIPVLAHTVKAFNENEYIDTIILVIKEDEIDFCQNHIVEKYGFGKVKAVVPGGKERQDSVNNALKSKENDGDYILIQDGARPFTNQRIICEVIEAIASHQAVTVGVPVKDTVKITKDSYILSTPDRSSLYAIQTPQGFQRDCLIRAYEKAYADGFYGTDDTMLAERLDQKVFVVMGDYNNIKITTKEDIKIGEAIANDTQRIRGNKMRVGIGYDVHAFAENRKLILGGVDIPYEKGLLGHSDADVLVHAIMDALLGACSLGDIGKHFPDTDEEYKGISSIKLLGFVKKLIEEKKYMINNIDAVVIAQKPKLAPYIEQMVQNVADILEIDPRDVGIKATTTEHLGFEGRGEGIAAQAIVALDKTDIVY